MPILFDASLYIRALRSGESALLLQRWARESPLWLSAVVLEELYAGAGPNEQRFLEKLERDFDKARRVLVPNLSDWTQAGRLLGHVGRRYGFERIGQARCQTSEFAEEIDGAKQAFAPGKAVLAVPRVEQFRLEQSQIDVRWAFGGASLAGEAIA